MKKVWLGLVISMFLVFISFSVYAAVPQTMNYQGYLTNSGGTPVNGQVGIIFSLYDVQSGGTALWTETQSAVQVTNGVYSATLGSTNPINLAFDAQYYLGVKVGTDAEMTPRQALTSVGYAIKAKEADTVAAGSITDASISGSANISVSKISGLGSLATKSAVDSADITDGTMTNSDIAAGSFSNITGVGTLTSGTWNASAIADAYVADNLAISGGTINNTPIGSTTASTGAFTDISATGNLTLPATTATTGIIKSGANTLIHTYGLYNFFAGINAGNLTMSGGSNTASGYQALSANTIGICNTASGTQALYSNTEGTNNTASGRRALYANTRGNYNTASGWNALYSNTEGYYNTASGIYSLFSNTIGDSNTASGAEALPQNTTGYGNTASGYQALYSNTTGNYNTAIGYYADVSANNLTNATAIGYNAKVNASNKVRIGNSDVTVIEGQVAWSNPSDLRLKQDVQGISRGLDFIASLRPVEYSMINGNGRKDFGFIAQDIEALLGTKYNVLGIAEDADRTLSLRYTDFIAPVVKAVQEQQEIIEVQKEQIKTLEERLARLEALIGGK